jgi:solute carrier family 7 (L-type amino acid transporter), member 6
MLGTFGTIAYSLVVSISALGSLNSNIFATGRLCARAGERGYLPGILANRHFEPGSDELDYYRNSRLPSPIRECLIWFAAKTQRLRLEKQVPM